MNRVATRAVPLRILTRHAIEVQTGSDKYSYTHAYILSENRVTEVHIPTIPPHETFTRINLYRLLVQNSSPNTVYIVCMINQIKPLARNSVDVLRHLLILFGQRRAFIRTEFIF